MASTKVASRAAAPAGTTRPPAAREPEPSPDSDTEPEQDPTAARKVVVSGFELYTQPQDLIRAFAKFGDVTVERCRGRLAVLAFGGPAQARAALQASRRVAVYGRLLTVKPVAPPGAAADARPAPRRDFTRTKRKGVIVSPEELELSGDFHEQLDNVLAAVRLTQDEVAALAALYSDLEHALQAQWPGCIAIPFGSITTGLGIKTSDADCFILVPPQHQHPNANFVNKAKRLLQQHPQTFAEILSIPRANTPIVKFFHVPTGTNCDVTFKTPLGAQNSKLIAFLLHADPRLVPVAVAVKYWAKAHELSGSGKLTNYALTMLIVFYLQQPPAPLLPPVRWLQRDAAHDCIVDGWNTGFDGGRASLPPVANEASISELLGGFFQYYSVFDFDEMVVCPYLGVALRKDLFREPARLPPELARYADNVAGEYALPLRVSAPMCVQDPFEQCHNVACTVTSRLASDVRSYFKFAAAAYEKEKANECRRFLGAILLQKPKIIRSKTNPEYRVNLFPRIVNTILNPEWKTVVRDLVMIIFESMLRIKLGKVEEKVNPDTKKEKEKYMGFVTRAIWKRKQFSRLYSVMNVGFREKQERITDEILSVDKEAIGIQFQLTVTYCHEPRSAMVGMRMAGGNVDSFREFGKFFISIMQNWFLQLLKPFAKPNTKDTATKIAETVDVLDDNLNDIETDDDDDIPLVLDAQNARIIAPSIVADRLPGVPPDGEPDGAPDTTDGEPDGAPDTTDGADNSSEASPANSDACGPTDCR